MREFVVEYLEQYFDEVEPMEFYRAIFPEGQLAKGKEAPLGVYHAIIIDRDSDKEHPKRSNVYDDLETLSKMINEHRDAVIAPVQYIGKRRLDKNARYINALTIDLDGIEDVPSLNELKYQFDDSEQIPKPTFLVWSGNGLHLYYVLDNPVACYQRNMKALKVYKKALTKKVWNRYVTSEYKSPQQEAVTQPMRLVGGVTKDGAIVRAFAVGERVSTEYLDSFVRDSEKIGSLMSVGSIPLALAKELYPDWYERRIVKKLPRKTWLCNRGLYDRWLERLPTEAMEGHRYFCIMALAINAIKCGVSYEELEKDAMGLIPTLDALTTEENEFTEYDVRCALEAYNSNYITFPRRSLQDLTGIEIPPQRRNGRTQKEHLIVARTIRDMNQSKKGTIWNGRKSKREVVQAWRKANPEGKKAQCIRDTGLAKSTVYRHWEIVPEDGKVINFDFKSYREVTEYLERLRDMPREEFEAYYKEHKESILELLALVDEKYHKYQKD